MNKYLLLSILAIIFSCNTTNDTDLDTDLAKHLLNSNKDSISSEHKAYAEMLPVLDSLWKEVGIKKQLLQDNNLLDEHMKEVLNKFQDIMMATGSLTTIHQDSTKFHAPLKNVNEIVVERFNDLCKAEIKGSHLRMPEFTRELDYFNKNNYYIEMILKNELVFLEEKLTTK